MHTHTHTSSMWVVVGDIKKQKEAASAAAATEENKVLQFNLHKLSKQMDFVGRRGAPKNTSKIPEKAQIISKLSSNTAVFRQALTTTTMTRIGTETGQHKKKGFYGNF